MNTARQKMLAGELYDPMDADLVAGRDRARPLSGAHYPHVSAAGTRRHMLARQRRPMSPVQTRPRAAEMVIVAGYPIRSIRKPAPISPSGKPYTASMRTPITRPRKPSPAAASSTAVI